MKYLTVSSPNKMIEYMFDPAGIVFITFEKKDNDNFVFKCYNEHNTLRAEVPLNLKGYNNARRELAAWNGLNLIRLDQDKEYLVNPKKVQCIFRDKVNQEGKTIITFINHDQVEVFLNDNVYNGLKAQVGKLEPTYIPKDKPRFQNNKFQKPPFQKRDGDPRKPYVKHEGWTSRPKPGETGTRVTYDKNRPGNKPYNQNQNRPVRQDKPVNLKDLQATMQANQVKYNRNNKTEKTNA